MVSPAFMFSGFLVFEGWRHSSDHVIVAICYPPMAFNEMAAFENLIYNFLLNIVVVVTHILAYRAGKGIVGLVKDEKLTIYIYMV